MNNNTKIQQIKSMHSDSKKARLTIQDFKLPVKDYYSVSLPREGLLRNSIKKPILVFMNTQRRYKKLFFEEDDQIIATKNRPCLQLSDSIKNYLPTTKILNIPQQTLEYTQGTQVEDNPQDKIVTYTSMKINRTINHRAQRNCSKKYHQKKEVITQNKIPIISQPLFTISHFTDALSSIPKHAQTSIERFKLLKKTMIHVPQLQKGKRQEQMPQIPHQLRTLRVVKKTSDDKSSSSIRRSKFRTVLLKRPNKKDEYIHHDGYKIQGWEQQKKTFI